MINSQGIEGMYVLINPQNGTRVALGELFLLNGKTFKIEGGRAPHKQGSTGRIWVREIGDDMHQQEVFPHVHDLRWVMLGGIDDPESSFVQRTYAECPKKFVTSDFSKIERRVVPHLQVGDDSMIKYRLGEGENALMADKAWSTYQVLKNSFGAEDIATQDALEIAQHLTDQL